MERNQQEAAGLTNSSPVKRRKSVNLLEKVLLGAAPDETLNISAVPEAVLMDARAARLELVRNYLKEDPGLRLALLQEIEEAWRLADGKRGQFMAAVSERRAAVLSLAELSQFRKQASQAADRLNSELSRYLEEIEGFAGQPRS